MDGRDAEIGFERRARQVHVPSIFQLSHVCDAYEEIAMNYSRCLVCKLRGDRAGLERNFADMYNAEWSSRHYNNLHELKIDIKTGDVLSDAPVIPANANGEKNPIENDWHGVSGCVAAHQRSAQAKVRVHAGEH